MEWGFDMITWTDSILLNIAIMVGAPLLCAILAPRLARSLLWLLLLCLVMAAPHGLVRLIELAWRAFGHAIDDMKRKQ